MKITTHSGRLYAGPIRLRVGATKAAATRAIKPLLAESDSGEVSVSDRIEAARIALQLAGLLDHRAKKRKPDSGGRISIRVTRSQHERWSRAAEAQQISLSEWVVSACVRACLICAAILAVCLSGCAITGSVSVGHSVQTPAGWTTAQANFNLGR